MMINHLRIKYPVNLCHTLVAVLLLGIAASAQQNGPVGVQSNGVSISFQNSGGDATASKGVSISFQNAGGDAKGSNGVSISFQNAGDAAGGASSGVSIGFRDLPPCETCGLGYDRNAGTWADPVNTATGNFVFDKTDMTVQGRGLNFEFRRFYNSKDASTGGPLGAKWTHSFNLKVVETATTATVTYDDAHEEIYDRVSSSWVPKYPGVYNKLEKNADNTYTVTQKDKKKIKFKTNGKLDSITDRNNNALTTQYDGSDRLTRVNIPGGRYVDFTYDASNRITQITDSQTPTPRTVQYGYDENNNLVSVTNVRGGTYAFTYNANNNMLTARDPRNNVFVSNTYEVSPFDDTEWVVSHQTDASGNPTIFEYFPTQGKTKITDAAGNASYDFHDGFKRMIKRVDRLGKDYSYRYDDQNNRESVTDKNRNTTEYEYDANGNVTEQVDPYDRKVIITYNANNDPLTRTDELGNVISFEYDAAGNLIKTTEPLNKITLFSYDANGQLLTSTDALGRVTTNTYDSFGNLQTTTDALGNTTTFGYDAIGRRTSITNARSKTTAFVHDPAGNLLSVTDPLGGSIVYEYDVNDNRTKITDQRGNATNFTYDPNNLLLTVTNAAGGVTTHTYNSLNLRVSTREARNNTTVFEYDLEGRLKKSTDPLGNATQFEYDAQGNRTKVIDPKGNAVTFIFDSLNRAVKSTDSLGKSSFTYYDALGRTSRNVDALGRETKFEYDALGRLTKTIDAANKNTLYSYDLVGNRLTVTNPNGKTSSFTYDAVNRLKTRIDALGRTTTFNYDAVGNLIQKVTANNATINYNYSDNDRLSQVNYPNSTSVSMTYDPSGNRTQMTDAVGTSTYTFDNLNRLTTYVDAFGKSIGYEYDANSNRKALIYPDGKRVEYAFDSSNRMTTATDWANRVTQYNYDQASLLTGLVNANGTTAAFGYDNASRLLTMNNRKADNSVISTYNFTLDPVGNRTNITQTEPLTAGNNQPNVAYTYNDSNQILTAGATTFTSDNNGNLRTQTTGPRTINFDYDFEDRLITMGDGTTAAGYVYNGDGLRLAKTVNGTAKRFVLDPTSRLPRVLAETDAAGNITAHYTHGLGMIAKITPTAQYYQYHFDVRGSTIAISDSTQNIVNRYAYDPFGVTIARAEQIVNDFRYMGQHGVTVEPFDLMFASRRFYNPALGRFLTKDPVEGITGNPQTFNEYIYSLNNPVMLMDPTGRFGEKDGAAKFNENRSSDIWNEFLLALNGIDALCDSSRIARGVCSSIRDQLLTEASQLIAAVGGIEYIPGLSFFASVPFTIQENIQRGIERNYANEEILARIALDLSIGAGIELIPGLGSTLAGVGYSATSDIIQDWIIDGGNVRGIRVPGLRNFVDDVIVNPWYSLFGPRIATSN